MTEAVPTREVKCAPAIGVGDEGMGGGGRRRKSMKGLRVGMTKRAKEEYGTEPYLISKGPEKRHMHGHRLAVAVG